MSGCPLEKGSLIIRLKRLILIFTKLKVYELFPPVWRHESDQACVSQKTRKLLGPEDFSGLFSGEFLGSRKAFLNAPENTPDSHPSFSGLQRELDRDLLRT